MRIHKRDSAMFANKSKENNY